MRTPWAFLLAWIVVIVVPLPGGFVGPALHPPPPVGTAAIAVATPVPLRTAPAPPGPDPVAARPLATMPGAFEIEPNGSVNNRSTLISATGNVYTLTGSFTGGILDERNGSTIRGPTATLTEGANLSAAIEVWNAVNVTIEDLSLNATNDAVLLVDSEGVNVTALTVGAGGWAVDTEGSASVDVSRVHAPGTLGLRARSVQEFEAESNDLEHSSQSPVEVIGGSTVVAVANDGNNSVGGIVIESADHVRIAGNSLDRIPAAGIFLSEVSEVTLLGNDLSGDGDGLDAYATSQLSGDIGPVHNDSVGIELDQAEAVNLSNVAVNGTTSDGVSVAASHEVTLNASWITASSGTAISIDVSVDVTVSSDTISGYGAVGVWVENSSDVTILGDHVSAPASNQSVAILAGDNTNLTVARNSIPSAGVVLEDSGSRDLRLLGNLASGATDPVAPAVSLAAESDASLMDNRLQDESGGAVSIIGGSGLQIIGNNASGSSGVGLYALDSSNVTVRQNTVFAVDGCALAFGNAIGVTATFNVVGGFPTAYGGTGVCASNLIGGYLGNNTLGHLTTAVSVDSSLGTVVSMNNLSFSRVGFAVTDSLNVTVRGNQVWNDADAFNVSGNVGLWVYHNNFVGDQGWLDPPSQEMGSWDAGYAEAGNYWSNLTGPDVETGSNQSIADPTGDGIVDHPMIINGTQEDRYPLTFPWHGYSIVFTAVGLISGSVWTVVVNGIAYSSGSPKISVPEEDGPQSAFTYTIPRVVGYFLPTPTNGSGEDVRGDIDLTVNFAAFTYLVTFGETGLPVGTQWGILVAGTQWLRVVPDFQVHMANGSYSFVPYSVAGYFDYGGSGMFTVTGGTASVSIVYVPIVTPAASNANSAGLSLLEVGAIVGVAVVLTALTVALWRGPRAPRAPPPSSARSASPPSGPSPPAWDETAPDPEAPPPSAP